MKIKINIGKKKFVLLFGIFLILFSLSNANATPGCCVKLNEIDRYCKVLDSNYFASECSSSNFDSNVYSFVDTDNGFECSNDAKMGSILNACRTGCSVLDGVGTENVRKIVHFDNNGNEKDFYFGSCRNEHQNIIIACVIDNECLWRYNAAQCELRGGNVRLNLDQQECIDLTESNEMANKGCCTDNCRYGFRGSCSDFRRGEKCVDVCPSSCSIINSYCENGEVVGGTFIRESNCRDVEREICDENEYCSNDVGCRPTSNCGDKGAGTSWCEVPDNPEAPGEVHYRMRCGYGGGTPTKEECGLFRSQICLDGSCVNNQWKSCENLDSCTGDFCVEANGRCLPKYPPGFMFWKCYGIDNCYDDENWGTITTGKIDDFMCNVVDAGEEGCWRSGDCGR